MSYDFDPQQYRDQLLQIADFVLRSKKPTEKTLQKALNKFNKASGSVFTKNDLIKGLDWMETEKLIADENQLETLRGLFKMKPMRTHSGVAIITVLTKPFPCPGKCIFCPNDVRMPKSYLRDEPGAQRAERNSFDPYLQVYNRLQALSNIGHPTDKAELIILGGTWSYYPEAYQIWFIKRCFEAMNDFGNADQRTQIAAANIFVDADRKYERNKADGSRKSYNELIAEIRHTEGDLINTHQVKDSAKWDDLFEQQKINVNATVRCVGLVVETRPDDITIAEVQRIRKLGCTKVQIGIQTLDDTVNDANKRGHSAADTAKAFELLREAGFKVHAHIMPNLYLATPQSDLQTYHDLFNDDHYKPDELKIYPTSVIKHTELYDLWQQGKYQPYETPVLIDLIAEMMVQTPPYCRLTRVIRDIPSTDIEAGNLQTNLREVVQQKMKREGRSSEDIRWREILNRKVAMEDLQLNVYRYTTLKTTELFLSYVTKDDNSIAGFLRLSLPNDKTNEVFSELDGCAMIREVHVYGQLIKLGEQQSGMAQHLGLGTKLIEEAKRLAAEAGYRKLAVISAIGTRDYYAKRGFELVEYYQVASL